jgi:polar amino acid transport system substrate-binding protein
MSRSRFNRHVARNGLMAVFLALAALAAASPARSACEPPASVQLVTPGKLTMSVNPTIPPFQYVNEKGELVGMRVELGAELAKHLCLTAEYMRMDFAAMIPGLKAGRWDAINTGIVWTEERSKMMYMVPYERITMSVIVPAGNPLKLTKIEDLSGRSISVESGTMEEKRARDLSKMVEAKGLKPIEVRVFNNFGDAIQAVKAGQADGQLNLQATADHLTKQGGFEGAISGLFEETICFAFRDRNLAEAAAKAFTAMKADGSYDRIIDQWHAVPLADAAFAIKGTGPQ